MRMFLAAFFLFLIGTSFQVEGRAPIVIEGRLQSVSADSLRIDGQDYGYTPETLTVVRIYRQQNAYYEEQTDIKRVRIGTEVTAHTYGAYITRITFKDYRP